MNIGDISRRSGVSERMLRYYEQQGLIQPQRQASGYRNYTEDDVSAVELIRQLNRSGLKLESIRILLPCMDKSGMTVEVCNEIKMLLEKELAELNQKMNEISASRKVIITFLGQH